MKCTKRTKYTHDMKCTKRARSIHMIRSILLVPLTKGPLKVHKNGGKTVSGKLPFIIIRDLGGRVVNASAYGVITGLSTCASLCFVPSSTTASSRRAQTAVLAHCNLLY